MNRYEVAHIKDGSAIYYFLQNSQDMSIVSAPSKYLKHMTRSHRSPNTIRQVAYSLSYYLNYLDVLNLTVSEVVEMKYDAQHVHFTDFLMYLKRGQHTGSHRIKTPDNASCNAILHHVFGFYLFLQYQEEIGRDLRVLKNRAVSYHNGAGLRISLTRKTFSGFFREDVHEGRTIDKESICLLIAACTNLRDKLLILLLSETGFRIGEILGIRIGEDIDTRRHMLTVRYREENINEARAKNAENRSAMISEETYQVLLRYLARYRKLLIKSGYLFITLTGEDAGSALKVSSVYDLFKRLEKKTGIKATPHMLRHYFANERRKSGWNITLIAGALGHRNIATTQRYLNIEDEELEKASNAYFDSTKALIGIDQLL